ncbi:MAG: SseB family protein [Solobacterium sp.]|nr:SseB family protein [Solobacterium sp.]
MKKTAGWIFGILGFGMAFVMAATGSWLVMRYITETVGSQPFEAVFVIPVLTLLPLAVIETGYRIRSGGNPYREKRRAALSLWTKNAVFMVLFIFLAVNIAYAVKNHVPAGRLTVLCLLAAAGAYLFLRENLLRLKRFRKVGRLASLSRFTALWLPSVFRDRMTVHGMARVNDCVYITAPEGSVIRDQIASIEKDGRSVRRISDSTGMISLKNTGSVPEGAVLSCAKEMRDEHENNVINPFLKEMIRSYRKAFVDTGITPVLLASLCRAYFLVPARAEGGGWQDVTDPNLKVSRYYKVASSADASQRILPLFTDWEALEQYTTFMETKESMTQVLDFAECAALMEKECTGIVINPFNENPFYLTPAFVRHIRELPVYRDRFENQ